MRPGMGVTASMSLPWLWGPNRDRVRQAGGGKLPNARPATTRVSTRRLEVSEAHAKFGAGGPVLRYPRAGPAGNIAIDGGALRRVLHAQCELLEWVDVARSLLDLEMEMVVLHGDLQRGVASPGGLSERRSLERPCMRIRRHEYRRNH